ncbi:MAG: site-specific integrase [Myxococcota bacterium]|nr:site-specific integrase [Myxococcota bacterium]
MSADIRPPSQADSSESADFCLTPEEITRGRQTFGACLETFKAGEPRRLAEEALDILAAVISDGACAGRNFPWQQMRGYHAALTLSIVRETGSPSRVEALLCRHDDTRKFQQVADRYSPKQVQRMNNCLKKIAEESKRLGFTEESEPETAKPTARSKSAQQRQIDEGEVRALIAVSLMDTTCQGPRDALMIGLAFAGGLRTVDLVNLNLDNMRFDAKSGRVSVKFKAPGAKRARHIPLPNDQLIALEDWLAARGRKAGPLFCPTARSAEINVKRMTAAQMRELCDLRSEQAGVTPFAPNDLARSGLLGDDTSKRRRRPERQAASASASPLYGSDPDSEQEDEQIAARIHFPYRARPSL